MGYTVISYELHIRNDNAACGRLDKELAKRSFVKGEVDTVWTKSYPFLFRARANDIAKMEFSEAAAAARVGSFDLSVFASETAIVTEVYKTSVFGLIQTLAALKNVR